MIIYTFRVGCIKGLLVTVEVKAKNYKEAKHKILKHMYLHTEAALYQTDTRVCAFSGVYCNGYNKELLS